MTAPFKKRNFSKLSIALSFLLVAGIYSCSETAPKEETTPEPAAVPAAPKDSMMKMKMDTSITDTSGKGGQPTPPRN